MAFTYQDAIDHLVDYLGGTPTDAVQRDCRRAVQGAYRDLANAFRWSYLLTQGRVATTPPFADGSVQYRATAGPEPRCVTLTPSAPGGAWPAWAVGAYLRVGTEVGKVVRRVSDTVVALDEQLTFASDATVPAGSPYTLYRDSYLLPADFIATDQAVYERNFGGLTWVHPREWQFVERSVFVEGTPQAYTITGDPLYPGRMVLRVTPLPTDGLTVDFLYHRRPRELRVALANAGTLTATAGSAEVTGAGAAFTPHLEGAVLRLSAADGVAPTSPVGKNPAAWETRVDRVTGPAALAATEPAPAAFSAASYTASDPVDIEEGAMLNAFLRGCEWQLAINRTLKDKPDARALYFQALGEAKAADSRTFTGRAVGDAYAPRQRLRDMPINFNTQG